MTIMNEIRYATYTKTYKNLTENVNDEMKHIVKPNENNNRLQHDKKLGTKPKKLMKSKQSRSTYRNRTYTYNQLPSRITKLEKLAKFKESLKSYLM